MRLLDLPQPIAPRLTGKLRRVSSHVAPVATAQLPHPAPLTVDWRSSPAGRPPPSRLRTDFCCATGAQHSRPPKDRRDISFLALNHTLGKHQTPISLAVHKGPEHSLLKAHRIFLSQKRCRNTAKRRPSFRRARGFGQKIENFDHMGPVAGDHLPTGNSPAPEGVFRP